MTTTWERAVPFTQYKLPDGRKHNVSIVCRKEVYDKAMTIIDAGYRFECEVLTTGEVSLTISDDKRDHAIEVCNNNEEVYDCVNKLIMEFEI